jgi:hypothetical protein
VWRASPTRAEGMAGRAHTHSGASVRFFFPRPRPGPMHGHHARGRHRRVHTGTPLPPPQDSHNALAPSSRPAACLAMSSSAAMVEFFCRGGQVQEDRPAARRLWGGCSLSPFGAQPAALSRRHAGRQRGGAQKRALDDGCLTAHSPTGRSGDQPTLDRGGAGDWARRGAAAGKKAGDAVAVLAPAPPSLRVDSLRVI